MYFFFFFFFQAEDGIRDLTVTGVQTCALPILRSGNAGGEIRRTFRERAEEIVRQGAVGFGEMTAEHFAGGTPYQYAPADHPLFLLLADIAAQHRVVIDFH